MPYADGIRGDRKFRCGFHEALDGIMLMASEADRKFRCGFLRRLIHILMASETSDNSAAVF